jgi:hypothetical protein
MRKSQSSNIYYQDEENEKFYIDNKEIKTTNINILLNRVRKKNKSKQKKIIIFSISIISIVSFIGILASEIS